MFGRFLADAVALTHGVWVLLNIAGPLVSWRWPTFRFVHISMMAVTILIMISGQYCPLTTLEQDLRAVFEPRGSYDGGFIANYVSKTIHVEMAPWTIFIALLIWFFLWYGLYFTVWPKKK